MNTNRKVHFRSILLNTSPAFQRWIVVIVTIVLSTIFIVIGNVKSQPGFPLDDSWIHQTYARNLALTGRWEFISGEVSAGSTSPLWTMLLSLGYLLGIKNPFLWTTLLSVSILSGMALLCYETLSTITKKQTNLALAGCLILIFDWHLLWSAGSGMETLLYCFLGLTIFYLLLKNQCWLWIGILTGLIVWVRPDGITFLGPIFLVLGLRLIKKQTTISSLVYFLVPFCCFLFLYGWFNYSLSGNVLPNTFYAKQLEYTSALLIPLWKRLGQIFMIPLVGAGLFLIPGFLLSIKNAISKRDIWLATMILWFFGYGVLYAIKLPMVYQHGRYLFPIIPIYFLIGLIGSFEWINQSHEEKHKITKIFPLVYFSLILCMILYIVIGEVAYIRDIKTINRLMVEPAMWIKENTTKDSVVAAHDIGAMGYFSERKIIDLAGLIEPEIIPIIRDEQKIKEYLVLENADYLVVFKDWYKSIHNLGDVKASFEFSEGSDKEVVEITQLQKK